MTSLAPESCTRHRETDSRTCSSRKARKQGLNDRYYVTITANASSGKPQQLGDAQKQAATPKRLEAPNRLKQVQTPNQAGIYTKRALGKGSNVISTKHSSLCSQAPRQRILDAFGIPLNLSETACRTPALQHEIKILTASG